MKNCLFIMLLGITLAACSSSPNETPSTSRFQPAMSHMSSGKARITFVRQRNDKSVPIISAEAIDYSTLPTLAPRETATIHVNAGLANV